MTSHVMEVDELSGADVKKKKKKKISRGAPVEIQNGTQQDLNKMIDLVNF